MTKENLFKRLDEMINKLGKVGVDISYFPEKAVEILKQTAKEIADEQETECNECENNGAGW